LLKKHNCTHIIAYFGVECTQKTNFFKFFLQPLDFATEICYNDVKIQGVVNAAGRYRVNNTLKSDLHGSVLNDKTYLPRQKSLYTSAVGRASVAGAFLLPGDPRYTLIFHICAKKIKGTVRS